MLEVLAEPMHTKCGMARIFPCIHAPCSAEAEDRGEGRRHTSLQRKGVHRPYRFSLELFHDVMAVITLYFLWSVIAWVHS